MKSASYRLGPPATFNRTPYEPNSTERCKQKLVNPHPTEKLNYQSGTGECSIYMRLRSWGFPNRERMMSKGNLHRCYAPGGRGGGYLDEAVFPRL